MQAGEHGATVVDELAHAHHLPEAATMKARASRVHHVIFLEHEDGRPRLEQLDGRVARAGGPQQARLAV